MAATPRHPENRRFMRFAADRTRIPPGSRSAAGPRPSAPAEAFFVRLVDHFDHIGQVELVQEQWRDDPDSLEYVCVDTQRMVMEKSRYVSRAADLSGVRIRFWLKEHTAVVDMHFTPQLEPVGWFMPVTLGFDAARPPFRTAVAFVGIVVSTRRKIVVTGENALDAALSHDRVSEAQSAVWRKQLRRLQYEFMARRYPPAIVRNFALVA